MRNASRIWVCSLAALALAGCDLTLGPKTETRYVIVKAGVPVELLENRELRARVLTDETGAEIRQDAGGWIAMPPEHWESVSREIKRLRVKCGESKQEQE
jgi:ABC-type uncharacterized transport system permease subunit